MTDKQSEETKFALMSQAVKQIQQDIAEIKQSFKEYEKKYVTKQEFANVKAIVYGMVGIVLTAFIVAVVTVIFK